jgi:predicted metal-binding protein
LGQDKPIKRVRAAWTDVILVCRKCSKRLGGGFGTKGTERLAKSLRKILTGETKGRKANCGVIEIGCLNVCPKNAVMVLRAGAPNDWMVVPKGAPIGDIVARLGVAPPTIPKSP